jgi:hypothetical protein
VVLFAVPRIAYLVVYSRLAATGVLSIHYRDRTTITLPSGEMRRLSGYENSSLMIDDPGKINNDDLGVPLFIYALRQVGIREGYVIFYVAFATLCGSLIVALYLSAAPKIGRRRAFIAASTLALWPPLVYGNIVNVTPLFGVHAAVLAVVLFLNWERLAHMRGWAWLVVAAEIGLLLAAFALLRRNAQTVSLMLFVAVFVAFWSDARAKWLAAAVLAVCMVAVTAVGHRYPTFGHPLWHPMYLGLADFDTKYGIRWDDGYGVATVAEANPGVRPYSPEYEAILKAEFIRLVTDDPAWYTGILLKRAWRLLQPVASPGWLPPTSVSAAALPRYLEPPASPAVVQSTVASGGGAPRLPWPFDSLIGLAVAVNGAARLIEAGLVELGAGYLVLLVATRRWRVLLLVAFLLFPVHWIYLFVTTREPSSLWPGHLAYIVFGFWLVHDAVRLENRRQWLADLGAMWSARPRVSVDARPFRDPSTSDRGVHPDSIGSPHGDQ